MNKKSKSNKKNSNINWLTRFKKSKKYINKNSKLIIIITILLLLITGVTLAFFMTSGQTDQQSLSAGYLDIEYIDGQTIAQTNGLPIIEEEVEDFASKTNFTVKNTGTLLALTNVSLIVNDLPEELKNEDFRWTLFRDGTQISEGSFKETKNNKLVLKSEDQISPNSDEVNYSIAIWIRDNGGDQNAMMNKQLDAKINVTATYRKLIDFALNTYPYLEGTANNNLIHNLKIYGNTVGGDSVGDKNLFPFTEGSWSGNNVTVVAKDGKVTFNGLTTDSSEGDTISAITMKRVWHYADYMPIREDLSFVLEPGTYVFKYSTNSNNFVNLIVGDLGKTVYSSENPALYIQNNTTFTITEPKYCMPLYYKYKNYLDFEAFDIKLLPVTTELADLYEQKYTIPIKVTGKNIADPTYLYNYIAKMRPIINNSVTNYTPLDSDGRRVFHLNASWGDGHENYSELRKIFYDMFRGNTQYTLSFEGYSNFALNTFNLEALYSGETSIPIVYGVPANTTATYTFTSQAGKTLTALQKTNYGGTGYIYMDTLQIENGTKKTKYEPYQEKVFSIYLDQPLRSNGDVKDYIDFEQGKVVRWIDKEGNILNTPKEEYVELPDITTMKGVTNIFPMTIVKPTIEGSY